jgi:putative peptide zinc metalloprotease protein
VVVNVPPASTSDSFLARHAPEDRGGAVDRFLTEETNSSQSELWHKVSNATPKLATHASIIRQKFGSQIVYVIEDPAGGQFYRMTEPAYLFVGLLDGVRTVESAWEATGLLLGEDAPTQRACVEVLAALQGYGLLAGQTPLDPMLVARRRRDARSRALQSRTGRGLAPVIPLVNPQPLLDAIFPLLRRIFSRTGFFIWLALLLAAGLSVGAASANLWRSTNQLLDPANLVLMSVMFIFIRAWHEFGHACATRAMGGRCTEIGLMFFAFVLPFPYCDASSAWRFQEVWRRVVVSAGGIIFELALASVAAIVWSATEPGSIHTVAFNVMILSSITTIFFNLNPLLRYDGYYILSDILGISNLAQRSTEMLRFVTERGLFRIRTARPPSFRSREEAGFLLGYSLLAWPYRLSISFAIVVVIASQYLTFGVVLAAILAAVWLVWPILKGIGYLIASPRLIGRRSRAIGLVGGVIVAAVLVLGLVPVPDASYAPASIEPKDRKPIRSSQPGFLAKAHVRVGDTVRAGDLLMTLTNPEIESNLGSAKAKLELAMADLDRESIAGDISKREIAQLQVETAKRAIASARREADDLILRAPSDGVFSAPGGQIELTRRQDAFFSAGTLMGEVLTPDAPRVVASISDREQAYVFGADETAWTSIGAAVRVRGDAGRTVPCRVVRVYPAGQRRIGNAALSSLIHGDIAMDPTDPKRERTLVPQFTVELEPLGPIRAGAGTVARVRFSLPAEPLFTQYLRRARQYLAARWS